VGEGTLSESTTAGDETIPSSLNKVPPPAHIKIKNLTKA